MPQITSCPECSKKLRVPDDLIGKKVKCPGCTTMFIAEADDTDEETAAPAPTPKPASRGRSDAVASGPKSGSRRREEEEEEEEVRRPRRNEENGDRGVRARRDDEDDDRRSRGRDDDDDRRSRSRRDDDYDDDDRRSRRRSRDDDYDYEPSPRQIAQGWQKVRTGINLAVMAGWVGIGLYGVALLAGGVMLLLGGSMIGSLIGGNPQNAANTASTGAVGMMGGMCIFGIIILLLALTELVLRLTGYGMCMAVPKLRHSSCKGLAIAAFSCAAAAVFLNLTGSFMGGFGGGLSGSGMGSASTLMALSGGSNAFGMLSNLFALAGYILWIILLRAICIKLDDHELGGKILTVLISQIVYAVVTSIAVVSMFFILGMSVASGMTSPTAGGAASAIGFGFILCMIIGGLLFIGWLGLTAWCVVTMQKIRDLVDYHIDRI